MIRPPQVDNQPSDSILVNHSDLWVVLRDMTIQILISILLYGYEHIMECISQVEQMIMVKAEGLQKIQEDSLQSKVLDF
jgi:hypothetical protein